MRYPAAFLGRCSEVAVIALLIVLGVAGDRAAWSAPPLAPGSPITLNGTLMGTVVVQDGQSLAILGSVNGYRQVAEGEDISEGVRLRQVRTDRIVVERGGAVQEIRLGSTVGVVAPSDAATAAALERPTESVRSQVDERQQRLMNTRAQRKGPAPTRK
jgi:hypothetical protein